MENKHLILNALTNSYITALDEENYEEAKKCAESLQRVAPEAVEHTHKIAYVCLKQEKWQEAIEFGLKALAIDEEYVPTLNLMSHAYGAISDWEKSGHYGHLSLTLQDKAIPEPSEPMIALPAPKDGKRIISFSLFGNKAKYIETAVLNVQVCPALFPGWVCRIYVDGSVPETAIQRLKNNGAEIIKVTPNLEKWPGTMWRFLAINDPEAEYVIFRDTDSVISPRESAAVAEWIKSGKSFHTMRDSGSHTDLVLAGTWGAKAGVVPNMEEKIQTFINNGYDSEHFADQDFLKYVLWGYMRKDILSHDRLFNFCNPKPFPELPFNPAYQIAFAEGLSAFNAETSYEEGAKIRWTLYSSISPVLNSDYSFTIVPEFKVCSYEVYVKNGRIYDNLPRRYGHAFEKGLARIDLEKI